MARQLPLRLLVFAAALLMSASVQAEVVTLVCNGDMTLDIDVGSRTVVVKDVYGSSTHRAQITQRDVLFGQNKLDRMTGLINWADGSQGKCERARGDILR